ncbi:hypothetical protein PU99_24330 [Pseudomonas putida]|nr:hypothetical protein PU99_24330 [Pseudomonas putida]
MHLLSIAWTTLSQSNASVGSPWCSILRRRNGEINSRPEFVPNEIIFMRILLAYDGEGYTFQVSLSLDRVFYAQKKTFHNKAASKLFFNVFRTVLRPLRLCECF